jgi:hypothetical protein
MKKVEIVRKGDIRRNRITWSNGTTSERWSLDSLKASIVQDERNGGIFIVPEGDPVLGRATAVGLDASAFDWITPAMLQEKAAVSSAGKTCFLYKGMMPVSTVNQDGNTQAFTLLHLSPVPAEAWIEAETLLPVALRHSDTHYAFTFQPAPAEPLVLPSRFQNIVDRYQLHLTPPRRLDNGR